MPETYQTAIEMALGASMQNIVTDTEEEAKKLVEYLRQNKLGRASFLPISSVKGKKLDKIKGKNENILGVAADLIKYDKKYEQIILNLLGRTVIVKNMDIAIKVAKENDYSFRIVTIDGDLINPSGAITGGFVGTKTVNILGRSKEIETLAKDIQGLKQNIEDIKRQKEHIIQESENVFQEVENIKSNIQKVEIQLSVEKQKNETIIENIQRINRNIEKIKQDIQVSENQKIEFERLIEENNKRKDEINEKNKSLEEFINQNAEQNKTLTKEIDDLNFDITNLKISVSSFDESENSINEITNMINKEIESNKQKILSREQEVENIKQEIINLEEKIKENNVSIEKITSELSNSGENIEKLKEERIKSNEKLALKEQEQAEQFTKLEEIKAQMIKIDLKKTKTEEDLNSQINALWEEYELTPNATGDFAKPQNVSMTQKKVNNIRADLRALGSVNVDSIEEYKALKERYDFMSEQRLDLENTMAKLRKMIVDITNEMKIRFKEKFEIINKNFGEVFSELFGGGKAEISLEDENNILECGININVQPPGKKLQSMTLLSGGEKAFTAIALLFAILKMSPAPFCVLDEIEAALDDVNVYRYAEFLKKFAGDTQFLVITHRKGTMESADTVYGVTMEENGISKLLSMKLKQS